MKLHVALALVALLGCKTANPRLAPALSLPADPQKPEPTLDDPPSEKPAEPLSNEYLKANRYNRASVFLASAFEEDESDFSFAFEYERWMGETWGIGGLVDFADTVTETTLVAGSVYYHPVYSVGLSVSPGVQIRQDESERFAVRTGMYYDIPLTTGLSFGPKIYIDFLEGGGRGSALGLSFNVHF